MWGRLPVKWCGRFLVNYREVHQVSWVLDLGYSRMESGWVYQVASISLLYTFSAPEFGITCTDDVEIGKHQILDKSPSHSLTK